MVKYSCQIDQQKQEVEETSLNPENEVIYEDEDEDETQLPPGEDNVLQKSYHELQDKPMSSTLKQNKLYASIDKKIEIQNNSVDQSLPLLSVTFDNMLKTLKHENSGTKADPNLSRKHINQPSVASAFYVHRYASTASTSASKAAWQFWSIEFVLTLFFLFVGIDWYLLRRKHQMKSFWERFRAKYIFSFVD